MERTSKQNPYVGTVEETNDKVKKYYAEAIAPEPVLGAKEGIQCLKQMNFSLIIITSRIEEERAWTEKWLVKHSLSIANNTILKLSSELTRCPSGEFFDELIFTGNFNNGAKEDIEETKRMGKFDVRYLPT